MPRKKQPPVNASPEPRSAQRRGAQSAATRPRRTVTQLAAAADPYEESFSSFRTRLRRDGAEPVLRRGLSILEAFVEAQIDSLWNWPGAPQPVPAGEFRAIAADTVAYLEYLPDRLQRAFAIGLWLINRYSRKTYSQPLTALTIAKRRTLLNQGETRRAAGDPPLIDWHGKPGLHSAVSGVAMAVRLVSNSRPLARTLAQLTWPSACATMANHTHVTAPAYPDLDHEAYDVCVVGSGAGGAIVAAEMASAGWHVLLVEEGDWISPHEFPDPRAGDSWPPRDDRALMRAFRYAGANVAGKLFGDDPSVNESRLFRHRGLSPGQTVNFIQAKVVGGGPYVNNAIHFAIKEHVWDSWRWKPAIRYADLEARMTRIRADLGATTTPAINAHGERTELFIDGAAAAGAGPGFQAEPMALSIADDSFGCGADNVVCPVGQHIGGPHRMAPTRPRSYLMRALFDPHATGSAQIAYNTRAVQFESSGSNVRRLLTADMRSGRPVWRYVHAEAFVLAAAPLASSQLLWNSGIRPAGLGKGLSGNIITPIFAVYEQPMPATARPDPGIAQCYFVPEDSQSPILENWFHFPGSLALALGGWFGQYASVIRRYRRLTSAGLVVPSQPRGSVDLRHGGRPKLSVSAAEFNRLLQGVTRLGRIFLAAAQVRGQAVELYLPTKAVLLDGDRPLAITDEPSLLRAVAAIRSRGAAFVNLATSHPQGGNCFGSVVDTRSSRRFRVTGMNNLWVADASLFPQGAEINPQLTVMALASFAAEEVDAQLRR